MHVLPRYFYKNKPKCKVLSLNEST